MDRIIDIVNSHIEQNNVSAPQYQRRDRHAQKDMYNNMIVKNCDKSTLKDMIAVPEVHVPSGKINNGGYFPDCVRFSIVSPTFLRPSLASFDVPRGTRIACNACNTGPITGAVPTPS